MNNDVKEYIRANIKPIIIGIIIGLVIGSVIGLNIHRPGRYQFMPGGGMVILDSATGEIIIASHKIKRINPFTGKAVLIDMSTEDLSNE